MSEGQSGLPSAGRFIIGSVDECVVSVQKQVQAGVTWLALRAQYPGSDPHRVLASIKRFWHEAPSRGKTA